MPGPPTAGPSRPRRKAQAENWDEDFDFDLGIGSSKGSRKNESTVKAGRHSRNSLSSVKGNEDWDAEWPSSPRGVAAGLIGGGGSTEPPHRPSPLRIPASPTRASYAVQGSRSAQPAPSSWTPVPHPVPSMAYATNDSTSSLGSAWSAHTPTKPSPRGKLRHMKSGDMMPPPPVPALGRRISEKRRSMGVKSISVEEEQPSPVGKKPGFWRRLSSQQVLGTFFAPSKLIPDEEVDRRNRSSFVGSPTKAHFSDAPPLPPLPPNIRSASNTSNASQHSGTSSISARSGLASILRRSSSNLASKVKGRGSSEIPPTPSMRIPSGSSAMSSHSLHSTHSRASASSSSRGYHLPSPLPQSPYNQSDVPPPLPTEQTTPKKKRPSSIAPRPGWTGDAWTGFPRSPTSSKSPRTGMFSRSPVKLRPALGVSSDPRTPTSPRAPQTADEPSAFKRLQSLGKKHGRRLSGGWKFGMNSPSTEARDRAVGNKLETVEGSPNKHGRETTDEGWQTENPSTSDLSRPSTRDAVASINRFNSPRLPSDTFDTNIQYLQSGTQRLQVKDDKERRRQSWNDFVIPRNVLDKQKELKEGIRGVRKFATGVESLKTLLSTHAAIEARVASADLATKRTFSAIEDDFDQWWEMATVLIEVGNTGQGISGSAASISSPTRNRRITLASKEAQAASNMMRRAQSEFPNSPTFDLSPRLPEKDSRKASLPDPADVTFLGGPPRASPDLWRGSTGRHEMSRRQLEVLRTMLQTPVSEPCGIRASTSIQVSAQPAQTSERFPSTAGSPYATPSDTIAIPITASVLAGRMTDQQALKMRKGSKVGLAGLKEFLKGLGKEGRSDAKADRRVSMQQVGRRASRLSISGAKPVQSPIGHSTAGIPLSRTTTGDSDYGQGVSRTEIKNDGPPVSGKGRRPGLRGIFRGGSGKWNDLTKTPDDISTQLERTHISRHPNPRQASDPVRRTSRIVEASHRADPNEAERTLRPRKSRVLGLGWPEEPRQDRSASAASGFSDDDYDQVRHSSAPAERISSDTRPSESPSMEEAGMIALTPENLPVLLDYLRQCEGKLGEWRKRVEALNLVAEG